MNRTLIAAGVLALLALGGCSSSDDGGVATAGNDNQAAASAAPSATRDLAKWADCMRDQGLKVSDPQADGQALSAESAGVPQDKLQAALAKCQPFVTGATGENTDSSKLDAFLRLAKCMRDHGYPMPDPQLDASGEVVFPGGVDRTAPHFKEAEEACEGQGPKGGPQGEGA